MDSDMGISSIPGLNITMALTGKKAFHISPCFTTFTFPDLPLSTVHKQTILLFSSTPQMVSSPHLGQPAMVGLCVSISARPVLMWVYPWHFVLQVNHDHFDHIRHKVAVWFAFLSYSACLYLGNGSLSFTHSSILGFIHSININKLYSLMHYRVSGTVQWELERKIFQVPSLISWSRWVGTGSTVMSNKRIYLSH